MRHSKIIRKQYGRGQKRKPKPKPPVKNTQEDDIIIDVPRQSSFQQHKSTLRNLAWGSLGLGIGLAGALGAKTYINRRSEPEITQYDPNFLAKYTWKTNPRPQGGKMVIHNNDMFMDLIN